MDICENCRFWHCYGGKTHKGTKGQCRRRAPSVQWTCAGEFGEFDRIPWPETNFNTWCGEFESAGGVS